MNYIDYINDYRMYGDLSAETKNILRNNEYIQIITNMLTEMFEITNLTHSQKWLLLKTCLVNGTCLIQKKDDKYIICGGSYSNIPEPYEIYPSEYVAVRPNFEFKGIPEQNNAAVFALFPDRIPLKLIKRYAYQLSEIDKSMNNNIQFSRIAPILCANNDTSAERFVKAIDNMQNGELLNIVRVGFNGINKLEDFFQTVDISDGNLSGKLQYLSSYYEHTISRLCRLFGHDYEYSDKRVYTKEEEYNKAETVSAVYPLMMLATLRECIDNFNNATGDNIKIRFSRAWRHLEEINENTLDKTPDISSDNIDKSKQEIHENENI